MEKKEKIPKETQEQIRKRLAEGISQENIGRELKINQSSLCRYIKEYHLHPYDELSLSELMQGLTISTPSVFFIEVPIPKRVPLKKKLLSEYGETKNGYGIVCIQEITNPTSGLLVFSNNHNLKYELDSIAVIE